MPEAAATDRPDHDDILLRHDAGGIATLTLNRPAQYNALSEALLQRLQDTLDEIATDEAVRVVVLAGAGKAFCAGHDLREMRSHPDRARYQALFAQCSRVMVTMTRIPQPIVARVHGIATAAGCQLVATCDLAVASTEARFAVSGIKVGLYCSTPGVALSRNVARKRAFEMLFTGDFIDAETAAAYHLVNRAVDPPQLDSAVEELARKIAAKPREAVGLGKQLFYRQIEHGLSEAYRNASEAMACNLMLADTEEGIDAFLGKRPPRWSMEP